jgi:hypothetical protein
VIPKYEIYIERDDGETVYGQVMYLIVWEGKPLSGSETLVRGDEIRALRVQKAAGVA